MLSRLAANHLFLGQFEPLRAVLLSLQRRDPDVSLSVLRTVVLEGGRFEGVLWSGSCGSPAHLAWLAALELIALEEGISRREHETLRLKVEFLLLIQRAFTVVAGEGEGKQSGVGIDVLDRLRWVSDIGLRRLKGEDRCNEGNGVSFEELRLGDTLRGLQKVFIEQAEVFDALCRNIGKQLQLSQAYVSELAATISDVSEGCLPSNMGDLEALVEIRRGIQAAHMDALKNCVDAGDIYGAISHIRFLQQDFGTDDSEYRTVMKTLIQKTMTEDSESQEKWHINRSKLLMIYEKTLSAGSSKSTQMIQTIHDEILYDEIEQHRVSDAAALPLPISKYLKALNLANSAYTDDQTHQNFLRRNCMIDMYHYARVSGSHILELVVETALSSVKTEAIQQASDVLSLFPFLQPLVAVMGWDLLSGKTEKRRNLMQMLWTSKSQVLRLEESSLYGRDSNEMSCVEYLCDLLCFHLDLASFVACVNSGKKWDTKKSILFARNEQIIDEKNSKQLDPFVENFVLERLTVQTPLRVLFDVVPGIKFQDAIELISMQPINSTTVAWRRIQDIELVHFRYALESAIIALGTMEKFTDKDCENHLQKAMWYMRDLKNHLEAISSIPRKVFLLSIVISFLYMDELFADMRDASSSSVYSPTCDQAKHSGLPEEGNKIVVSFTSFLLDILHNSLPAVGSELESGGIIPSARQALEWRIANIKHFVEDWQWRLSILQRLLPFSGRPWSWKEALAILRAAPSSLLNLCMQKAKYDIGEEAVQRFSLSAEDKAALELTEWAAGASRRASAEEAVSRAAEGIPVAIQELDFSAIRIQLGPLSAILLCIDVAVTSAQSVDMCLLLLSQARGMLSEIYPGSAPRAGTTYWDQIQEVAIISIIKRVLQRLSDILEQDKSLKLQGFFSGEAIMFPLKDHTKGQRQRALAMLHQMINDAHRGKRQFLSGKLHNLARVLADEDTDPNYSKEENLYFEKKNSTLDTGVVLGLSLRPSRPVHKVHVSSESGAEHGSYGVKESSKRLHVPFASKSSTYLSAFIVYIATIGDIVDGIDTTHDFNFFSLVYEWPKDLITRLVFERESTDAAGKVAEIMCADFVHEVIAACVLPVFPPRSGHGWACIPLVSSLSVASSDNKVSSQPQKELPNSSSLLSVSSQVPQYPLNLNVVKHLAKLSPVRAILACVFGSSILSSSTGSQASSPFVMEPLHGPDMERLFYEFALDQSEMFPTLNRWIQMQSNLHRVSESAIAAAKDGESTSAKPGLKILAKRSREPESDTESDIDDMIASGHVSPFISDNVAYENASSASWLESPNAEIDSLPLLSLDWENEQPYEKAVERLINEGKLMDALALSDRFLRDGASDNLLKLLIEYEEENNYFSGQFSTHGAQNYYSNSWQYCLRLKDKQLAAKMALKYLHKWELDAAVDVLTMCCCHLLPNDPVRNEVLQMRRALQKYDHILSADDTYSSWQEVEMDCMKDPEGLALRLAGKGAVSAALEVAESASLSVDLRRELQGRQLVRLLTTDPLSGGGPAEASRFLSSLPDPNDALPVAMGAMQLLPDLRSKQLLVHFFLKRRAKSLSDAELTRLNSWALGLRVLSVLPVSWQQRCSALHEHPRLIVEVLLMNKQLQYASLILKEFPLLRDDNLILTYAAKAIVINTTSASREPRISISGPRSRQKPRTGILSRSNITNSLSNLQKEARRAFSWAPRDAGSKSTPKDTQRKRKSSGTDRTSWEAMPGIQEERVPIHSVDGHERFPLGSVTEEWTLTGDIYKDNSLRTTHKYETSPDIVLLKGLLSLCSDEVASCKGALDLCINQMKNVLNSGQLPLTAATETIGRAYHATEAFVQGLMYAKAQLRKLSGSSDLSSNYDKNKDADDASVDTSNSSISSQQSDEFSELQEQADIWLGRAELLQSLLGSGIIASLDDIADRESSTCLRDRLINDERYSMAIYTCKKCKIDAFPVWNAWGHALIRIEHYAQARIKFKQALQLYKGDPSEIILEIINAMEGGPPVDISAVQSIHEHLAKSVSTILDDSLSADAYLNVLYMPSTFPRSERSRRSLESTGRQSMLSDMDLDDGPRSNLDSIRYVECIYYLKEYACPKMLGFMFRHGHYTDACLLFFPLNALPVAPPTSTYVASATSSPQRPDPLATEYGTIEDLCDFCLGYGAMDILEDVLASRISSASNDASVSQYIIVALNRICSYCETHRHFNYLYKFQVLKSDHVAAGLCCIQLYMNSASQEEAIKHLENAKTHFDEALSARNRTEVTKVMSKAVRGKTASEKLTDEGLVKFAARVSLQVDVIRSFNDTDGSQWKHSLFGNPSDPETFRRRCEIAETLTEKNFDLAFQVVYQFNLPAVDIYAGVAATLAERKRSSQLTEFFKNIKGTIGEDDWDQVLGAAINVYANKHKERPDRLIDMLISSHRKVLACVVCGRLKSAFQIASRSGSIADVQYVAHQALHANALPVLDMCKQWLAQYM